MKSDFGALWAETPSTLRREPTNAEVAGGFPCGPLDLQLWNELMFRMSGVLREVNYTITQTGQTPNAANNTQLWQAIQSLLSGAAPPTGSLWHYGDDTGGTNTLVVNATPDVKNYTRYIVVQTRVANTNLGPATIDVDGLGPKSIVRADGTPLRAGDLVAGEIVTLLYDGTNFQLSGVLTSFLPSSAILIFTQSATYTIPPGITKIKRGRVWGGGGGGGGSTGVGGSGSGGGGGGYSEATDLAVIPGQRIVIDVGLGGFGGSNGTGDPNTPAPSGPAGNGNNGGTTFVAIEASPAWITAIGGGRGTGGSGFTQGNDLGVGGIGIGPGLTARGGGGSFGYTFGSIPGAGSGGAGAFGGGPPTLNVGIGNNIGNFPAGGANGGVGGYGGGVGGGGLAILEI